MEGLIRQREDTIHGQDSAIESRRREIDELHRKLSELKAMKSLNEQLNKAINKAESDRVDLQNTYDRAMKDHKAKMEKDRITRNKLLDELDELSREVKEREAEIMDLKRRIQDLENKVDEHLEELKNRQAIIDEVTKQREDLSRELKIYQK